MAEKVGGAFGMNILSLFDGISVGYLALKRAGIHVDQYIASEIDKYAIKISKKNFPDIIHIGSVEEIDVKTLPKIDLLIGGSPCQGFSSAGKKLNFEDPRSKLFFEFVRIKNELTARNPNLLFLLENVKMKREWENLISHYMGIYPVEINSALVSAQTRKRLYWTNIRTRQYSMFGDLISDIPQPEDRGIYLKDIIENGYTEKDKTYCILRGQGDTSGSNPDRYLRKKSRQIIWKNKRVADKYYLSENAKKNIREAPQRGFSLPKINPDKVGPIDTANNAAQLRLNAGTSLVLLDAQGDLYEEGPRTGEFSEGALSDKPEEKTLKAIMNRNPEFIRIQEATKKGYVEVRDGDGVDLNFPNSKTRRGRRMRGKTNCLTAESKEFMIYKDGDFRRLTPLECERAQTLPDNFTAGVSDAQRYKCTGNCWTADVIAHIFSFLDEWRQ